MAELRKLITVITPCYNEELNLQDCHETIRQLFAEHLPNYDYEHLFCDNASTDRSHEILADMARRDPNVKVIFNARNFGPFCSTFNGLMAAKGDAVVVFLPADLQDPPELIPEFVRRWEEGYQIVYGIRKKREESWTMRTIRGLYYRMVTRFSTINIPPNVSEFQLVDRVVVEALRKFDDYYPYIRGMIASCGFRSVGIEHTWKARKRGFSKHRLLMYIDQGLNGLISFTRFPMRLCMTVGITLSVLSFLYAVGVFLWILFSGKEVSAPGIPTLIVAQFFFSGVQLFFLGVIGEYIGAIHSQVRKGPLVIERGRLNFAAQDEKKSAPPGSQAA